MAIQNQSGKSTSMYKISERNPCEVLTRPNRHNARWKHYADYATPEEARTALLGLGKEGDK